MLKKIDDHNDEKHYEIKQMTIVKKMVNNSSRTERQAIVEVKNKSFVK